MKKPYTKPIIGFQNMFLATGVNTRCAVISNHNFDSCYTYVGEWEDETIYTDGHGCDWNYDEYLCYNVPTESSNIFES